MHCCITFAICSCLFPLRPLKREKRKDETESIHSHWRMSRGSRTTKKESSNTKLFNICRSKLDWRKAKNTWVCVCVCRRREFCYFRFDTNRMLEHFSAALFRLVICNMLSVWNFLRSKRNMNLRLRCVKIELMIYSFNMSWPRRLPSIWFFNHFLSRSIRSITQWEILKLFLFLKIGSTNLDGRWKCGAISTCFENFMTARKV